MILGKTLGQLDHLKSEQTIDSVHTEKVIKKLIFYSHNILITFEGEKSLLQMTHNYFE